MPVTFQWDSVWASNVSSSLLKSMDLRVVVDLESTLYSLQISGTCLFFWRWRMSFEQERQRRFLQNMRDKSSTYGYRPDRCLCSRALCRCVLERTLLPECFFGPSRFERSFVVSVNGEKNESKQTKLVSKKSSPNQRTEPTRQTYQKNAQRHTYETYERHQQSKTCSSIRSWVRWWTSVGHKQCALLSRAPSLWDLLCLWLGNRSHHMQLFCCLVNICPPSQCLYAAETDDEVQVPLHCVTHTSS